MMETTAHIAVLYLEIFIPASASLKQKRSVLKRIKDRMKNKFNVSVAEIGARDKWQRAIFGVAALSGDRPHLDGQLQAVLSFMEQFHDVEIIRHEIESL